MQMCMRHWEMLRDKIKEEGLDGWVVKDGETAVAQLVDQSSRGKITPTNFDPLMASHNMILGNAIDAAGLAIFNLDENGNELCPLCYLNSKRTEDGRCACTDPNCGGKEPGSIESFDTWIDHSVKGCKQYMIEQG